MHILGPRNVHPVSIANPTFRVHEERPRPHRQRIPAVRIRQGGGTYREVRPIDDGEYAVANVTVLRLAELGPELGRPRLVAVIDDFEEADREPDGKRVAARGAVAQDLAEQLELEVGVIVRRRARIDLEQSGSITPAAAQQGGLDTVGDAAIV